MFGFVSSPGMSCPRAFERKIDSQTGSDRHRPETATSKTRLFRRRAPSARRGLRFTSRFDRRLAFDALALLRFRLEEGFGCGPMTLRPPVGGPFVEPQEISNLADAIVAISRGRPCFGLAECLAFRWRIGCLSATAQ